MDKQEVIKAVVAGWADYLEAVSGALPQLESLGAKAEFRTLEARITQTREDIKRWVVRNDLGIWYEAKYNDGTYAYFEPSELGLRG